MTSSNRGSGSQRGFASMDQQRQREIASEGGRAAHASGHAHQFTSEEARAAGRRGGESRGAIARAHTGSPARTSARASARVLVDRQQEQSDSDSSDTTRTNEQVSPDGRQRQSQSQSGSGTSEQHSGPGSQSQRQTSGGGKASDKSGDRSSGKSDPGPVEDDDSGPGRNQKEPGNS